MFTLAKFVCRCVCLCVCVCVCVYMYVRVFVCVLTFSLISGFRIMYDSIYFLTKVWKKVVPGLISSSSKSFKQKFIDFRMCLSLGELFMFTYLTKHPHTKIIVRYSRG